MVIIRRCPCQWQCACTSVTRSAGTRFCDFQVQIGQMPQSECTYYNVEAMALSHKSAVGETFGDASISSGGGRRLPSIQFLAAKLAKRFSRNQVMFDVESVLDRGVGGEKSLC